jgi:hypothetical protein
MSQRTCTKGHRTRKKQMKLFKSATTVFCLALTCAAIAPAGKAAEWDKKTIITFSEPVEIPGVHLKGWGVLPAGTYMFRVMDSKSDRHIVQIFNKEGTTIYATILAIPNYRLQPTDKTVITFRERPAGQPEALRAWFYPGMNFGEEFVYPKSRAIELATAEKTSVLFTPADIPVEVTEPIVSLDAPVVVQLRQAPVRAVQTSGEEVELAQVVTPPPAGLNIAELPKTASNLPLIGLLGLMALAGAFTVRAFGARS